MSDPITPETLLAAGYKEFPMASHVQYDRLFQRRVEDCDGTLYFINFREWNYNGTRSFDAYLSCCTSSGGTVWIAIKEAEIRETEVRAGLMWAAAGSVYYDV
jgi:hypothetical protein